MMLGLDALLKPTSVVVVGASNDPDRISGRTLKYLAAHQFAGSVLAVNPRHSVVQDRQCFPDVASLPEAPDLAVLSVPARGLAASLEQCAQRGIRAGVVLSAIPDDLVDEVSSCVERITKDQEFRLLGPNCNGLFNLPLGIPVGFSPAIFERADYRRGGTALIAQSGGIMASVFSQGQAAGLGIQYAVGTGSEFDVTIEDLVDYAVHDPDVTTIAVFAETFRKPDQLKAAASRAQRSGKHLIMLKGGRSARGRRAAASHTGALVGDVAHERAFLDALGVVMVDDISELWQQALLADRAPRLRGKGVGILTASGGTGVVAADLCADVGLSIPDVSSPGRERIQSVLDLAEAANPVDVTGQIAESTEIWQVALDVLLDEPGVDAVLAILSDSGRDVQLADLTIEAARGSRKPVVVCWVSDTAGELTGYTRLRDSQVPVFTAVLPAVRALGRATLRATPADPPWIGAEPPRPRGATRITLDESRARDWLEQRGLPQARAVVTRTAAELSNARPGRHTLPAMLKLSHPRLAHRARVGAVIGPLGSAEAVAAGARDLAQLAERLGLDDPSYVLAEYVERHGPELIVGVRNDFRFGPVVLAGVGGVAVEEVGEVVTTPAPCTPGEAASLWQRLPSWPRLSDQLTESDTAALAQLLATVSTIAWEHRDELAELDLNPVVVARDRGALALDALAVLRGQSDVEG